MNSFKIVEVSVYKKNSIINIVSIKILTFHGFYVTICIVCNMLGLK
jgi:hypothetical protein